MSKVYKFENITFNITEIDEEWEDVLGDSSFTFTVTKPIEDIEELLNNGSMGDITVNASEWSFNKFTFTVDTPDCFILTLAYFFENNTKGVECDYEGMPFWLAHDISHAKNDVIGSTIYVDEYREIEANRFAMLLNGRRKMKQLFSTIVPTPEYRKKIAREFNQRFKNHNATEDLLKVLRITNTTDEELY